MKVLWCTHSLVGFSLAKNGYNGCGWITSLLQEVTKTPDMEIGIAFFYGESLKPLKRDGVIFYPMWDGHIGLLDKIKTFWGSTRGWEHKESIHIKELKKIIEDFSPDVIHIWGTETEMGLIAKETSIPVILHLQGLLYPYNNMLCPPGFSKYNYIWKDGKNPTKILKNINSLYYWRYKAERETRIFSVCKNYFGRTNWDWHISRFMSPNSHYYYCSEMLRDEFYTDAKWTHQKHSKYYIVSTISAPLYKGLDMVLKTAKLLIDYGSIDFEWNVIGLKHSRFIEKKISIKAKDVHVNLLGVKTDKEIKEIELSSNLYFHPSYIDNSPNSVCEAQILGLPVISTNTGGLSSIIQQGVTGFLIPANEPHIAAAMIKMMANGEIDVCTLSCNERNMAVHRHNKEIIITSLIDGYNKVINKCGK